MPKVNSVKVDPSTIRKFASDTFWILLSISIPILINTVMRIFYGNFLDASSLGILTTLGYVCGLVTFFFGFDIGGGITKFVAQFKDKPEKDAFVSSALLLSFGLGLVALISLITSADFISRLYHMPELTTFLRLSALSLPLSLITGILTAMLRGLREMRRQTFLSIAGLILYTSMVLYVLISGMGLLWVVLVGIIGQFMMFPVILACTRKFWHFSFGELKAVSKVLLVFSSKIFGTNLLNYIARNVNILTLGYFVTAQDVGIYSIALLFPGFALLLARPASFVTYPTIAEYHGKGMGEAIEVLASKAAKYSFIAASFVGLIMVSFSSEALTIVFPGRPEYLAAVLPIYFLVFGAIAQSIPTVIGGIYTAVGRPDVALKLALVVALITVLLVIVMSWAFGIRGTALATMLANILSLCLFIYFIKPITHISLDIRLLLKNVLIVLPLLLGCAYCSLMLDGPIRYALCALGVLLYPALLAITGIVNREDIDLALSIIRLPRHSR